MTKFFDLELNPTEAPQEKDPLPRKGVVITTLGTVISWAYQGKVANYDHNRGDGRIDKRTSDSAYSGVKPDIIGEATVGYWEKDGETRPCFNNFHSRLHGFIRRFQEKKMSPKELNTQVAVRIQEDFLEGYMGLNPRGGGHKTKNMICCPDLTYGGYIRELFKAVGPDCVRNIGDNRWTVLSSILFNLGKADATWYWPEVYTERGPAGEIANKGFDEKLLKISEENLERLILAVQFWDALMNKLAISGKNVSKLVNKIRGSAGFFGYVVCDRLAKTPALRTNQDFNVKRILDNIEDVKEYCPELCRGNWHTLRKYVAELDKALKGKAGVVQQAQEIAA